MDLATGEGALFRHGGLASADLNRHKIWVCLLFEPFLQWLYQQPMDRIPDLAGQVVELPGSPTGFHGYRRPGCPLGHTKCTCRPMPLAARRRRSTRRQPSVGRRRLNGRQIRALKLVRRLPSNRASPQGPDPQDRPPAAAQAGPGSPAESSGRHQVTAVAG